MAYKVAVVGVGHMHVLENTRSFIDHPEFDVVGWADVPPETEPLTDKPHTRLGNLKQAQKWGQTVYADYRAMLNEQKPDIVILCSENSRHGELALELLNRGIHLVIEKPMATTLREAREMASLAEANNLMLAVNWPSTWSPTVRLIKEMADSGAVGQIFKFLYRNARSIGPLTYALPVTDAEKAREWWHSAHLGGGAFYDYCCYGTNLSRYILGEKASSAFAIRQNVNHPFGTADDNGIIVGQFPSKAVAVLEGSWTTVSPGVSNGPIVYGLAGTLVADAKLGNVSLFTDASGFPTEVRNAPPLPENANTLAKVVLGHLSGGEPLHPTMSLAVNLDAMALLDAGLRSCASGAVEKTE